MDALAVWDTNGNGKADPGTDYAIFSLDRGSPSLGASSAAPLRRGRRPTPLRGDRGAGPP